MKFVEKCFVLEDDVIKLRNNEMCAAITYQSIQKHLLEDHIHFSFLIKKNVKEPSPVKTLPDKKEPVKAKPKPEVYKMPNKGSLRGNNSRKGPSVPEAKQIVGSVVKKEVVLVEVEEMKSQPPCYSSINKIVNNNQFTSPAHCTQALKRNDDELVGTNLSFT